MEARKETLVEIDQTIDQLIINKETLDRISIEPNYLVEKEALEKTQESLLAHLTHLQAYLQEKGASSQKLTLRAKKMMNRTRVRVSK